MDLDGIKGHRLKIVRQWTIAVRRPCRAEREAVQPSEPARRAIGLGTLNKSSNSSQGQLLLFSISTTLSYKNVYPLGTL